MCSTGRVCDGGDSGRICGTGYQRRDKSRLYAERGEEICLCMGIDRCRMNLACLRDWNGEYQRRDKSRLYAEREEEICLYIKINIG